MKDFLDFCHLSMIGTNAFVERCKSVQFSSSKPNWLFYIHAFEMVAM